MTRGTSVVMTGAIQRALRQLLLRADGQEDLCLATYRPSNGETRTSALIRSVIPPQRGDREVHGNVTVTADYILRGAEIAQKEQSGLVLLHSHPGGRGWQNMSGPDRDTEASYANLARELTGAALVGMTLAGGDGGWSARHWDHGVGTGVTSTDCGNVRVVDDRLAITWNDHVVPPPPTTRRTVRTVSAWGEHIQSDLTRRRILVVGAGSVGLDVATRLAASGAKHLTIMDFDIVQDHNLDRLIGASRRDAALRRAKTYVARRQALRNATATNPQILVTEHSICEPKGLRVALDHDLIFCCVDRPWPRAVLNALAYTDLIPVIDGGIAIDTLEAGGMRNATWRSHVIRPGRPCMSCNRQLDIGRVALDIEGLLDDANYIAGTRQSSSAATGQNVAALSISVAASLLAQYVSFSVAPGGLGDPGPLQYILSTHHLEHLPAQTSAHCPYEATEAIGDQRQDLTGHHHAAEVQRQRNRQVPNRIKVARWADDRLDALGRILDRIPQPLEK